jgi:hypothetical protein
MRAGSLVARVPIAVQIELLPKLMRYRWPNVVDAYVLASDGEMGRQGLECLDKQ